MLICIGPIWVSCLMYAVVFAQPNTFFCQARRHTGQKDWYLCRSLCISPSGCRRNRHRDRTHLQSVYFSICKNDHRNLVRPNNAPQNRSWDFSLCISDDDGSSSGEEKATNCQRTWVSRSTECNHSHERLVVASTIHDAWSLRRLHSCGSSRVLL